MIPAASSWSISQGHNSKQEANYYVVLVDESVTIYFTEQSALPTQKVIVGGLRWWISSQANSIPHSSLSSSADYKV